MEIRWPSREQTRSWFSFTSNNSPDIAGFESLTAIEKIVWRIRSFKTNCEITMEWSLLNCGSRIYVSGSSHIILNFAFSDWISAVLSSICRRISLSGSFRMISAKSFALIAVIPWVSMRASMVVSIPSSVSLAVRTTWDWRASIRMHSKIL